MIEFWDFVGRLFVFLVVWVGGEMDVDLDGGWGGVVIRVLMIFRYMLAIVLNV